MQIYGFNKTTLLDYLRPIAATVFTGGCNFLCPLCDGHRTKDHGAFPDWLLSDSYGFHIHAHHMYVLPRGCAHDENTSLLDYNQVYH